MRAGPVYLKKKNIYSLSQIVGNIGDLEQFNRSKYNFQKKENFNCKMIINIIKQV